MADRRVCFDFEVEFSNGGGLQGQDFRLDLDGDDIDDQELAAFIIRDLRLLMVGSVRVFNKRLIVERHKRAVGAKQADRASAATSHLVDLSHATEQGRIDRGGNGSTPVDAPFQCHAEGQDLSHLPLSRLIDVPGVLVRLGGTAGRAIDWHHFVPVACRGHAVLIHTGWDRNWRSDHYCEGHPFLTERAALYLRDQGALLVGIDSFSVDASPMDARPVHAVLRAAEIPVVEDLTGLSALPAAGFRFSAVPPRLQGAGRLSIRAYARIDGG
ncbi:cyclase family protein [Labrys sp. KNU-23]|uniref:cyclase family protein n=1 Tax=Labrys sp. KNU-23 TaxID=2789216 RepID=UPI0011EEE338|nr:cyclase family protein [Labrys sp. KNU-23]QEN86673.1 cyclase family protein [Labrys sp. KNU-23]